LQVAQVNTVIFPVEGKRYRFGDILALMKRVAAWMALAGALSVMCVGEDWPEFRGKGRGGAWRETGILDKFPASGLKVLWRSPIGAGFAGPAVSEGRVFVTDFGREKGEGIRKKGIERAVALDEKTGKLLWTREWAVDYRGISYDTGPRATPTVDGDRVYVVGASGILSCLNVATGALIWRRDYVREFGTTLPTWGISGAPVVDGDRLIAVVGGSPDAKVVAFDKRTGKEIWRALTADSEPGYSQPVMVEAGGNRQVIVWHPGALVALDPATGKVNWLQEMRVNLSTVLGTPVVAGGRVLVSSFYNGAMLVDLAGRLLWKGKSSSEINTDGLHAVVNTPAIDGAYIYGICSYGQFRCLRLATGERVWETMDVTKEKARWASGFIVKNGERYFINNDRGELIIARLKPTGYEEIDRAQMIQPTTDPGNRRELGKVNWTHPAYANRHLYTRNDEEIIAVDLEK